MVARLRLAETAVMPPIRANSNVVVSGSMRPSQPLTWLQVRGLGLTGHRPNREPGPPQPRTAARKQRLTP